MNNNSDAGFFQRFIKNLNYGEITKRFLSIILLFGFGASIPARAVPLQFGSNFYEFVSADFISWQSAKTSAESSVFMGSAGYLATITSAAENDFIANHFATFSVFSGAWIGGQVSSSGVGTWATGPEAGQVFSQGGLAVSGAYANWGGIEPNSPPDNKPSAAYMNVGSAFAPNFLITGEWADADYGIASSGDPIRGYIVEYSGVSVPVTSTQWLLGIGLLPLIWRSPRKLR